MWGRGEWEMPGFSHWVLVLESGPLGQAQVQGEEMGGNGDLSFEDANFPGGSVL